MTESVIRAKTASRFPEGQLKGDSRVKGVSTETASYPLTAPKLCRNPNQPITANLSEHVSMFRAAFELQALRSVADSKIPFHAQVGDDTIGVRSKERTCLGLGLIKHVGSHDSGKMTSAHRILMSNVNQFHHLMTVINSVNAVFLLLVRSQKNIKPVDSRMKKSFVESQILKG